jgi:propionyl-CoA carboxylase alpha chain
LPFGKFVLKHPEFVNGKFDTHFVQNHYSPEKLEEPLTDKEKEIAALFGGYVMAHQKKETNATYTGNMQSNWQRNRLSHLK